MVLFELLFLFLSHTSIQTLAKSFRFYPYSCVKSTFFYFSHGLLQWSSTRGDFASPGNTDYGMGEDHMTSSR